MTSEQTDPTSEQNINGRIDERKARLLTEVHGDVTSTHVHELRHGLADIIERSDPALWKALYLDIRAARMIDCMGINWIYAEANRLRNTGKNMTVRISSPAINRVMRYVGLEKIALIKFRRRKQTR